MQISAKTPLGKFIALEVDANDTIEDTKEKIEETENCPAYRIKLFFNGKLLEDNKILSECEIQCGAQLNVWFSMGSSS